MARQDLGPASTLTRITAFCLLVGFYLACTAKDDLTTPSSTTASGSGGQASIMASPSDIRQSPSNIRPSPSDIRPSPSDIRSSPASGPSGTPSGSPSGSPSGTPTPTPTPTVPCPPTLTINGTGLPGPLSTASAFNSTTFPQITTNYGNKCGVKDVNITLQVATVSGFTSSNNPNIGVDVCGSGLTFGGCSGSSLYGFFFNATGNQIGTTCGDFVFDTTATTVFNGSAPPAAPYSGTYQLDPGRTGVGDKWLLKDLQYSIVANGHPSDTILQCAKIVITTQIFP